MPICHTFKEGSQYHLNGVSEQQAIIVVSLESRSIDVQGRCELPRHWSSGVSLEIDCHNNVQ